MFIYMTYRRINTKRMDSLQKIWRYINSTQVQTNIVKTYLITYRNHPKRPRLSTIISDTARYDRKDHLITPVPKRRWATNSCISKQRNQCQKCKVGLCVLYFASYCNI